MVTPEPFYCFIVICKGEKCSVNNLQQKSRIGLIPKVGPFVSNSVISQVNRSRKISMFLHNISTQSHGVLDPYDWAHNCGHTLEYISVYKSSATTVKLASMQQPQLN